MHKRNFSEYLGGIEMDKNGKIVSAKATFMRWFGRSNITEYRQQNIKLGDNNERIGTDSQPVSKLNLC